MICPRCGYRAEFDEVGKRVGSVGEYTVRVECQRCLYIWEQAVSDNASKIATERKIELEVKDGKD